MIHLKIVPELEGEGKYTPQLPWVEGSREEIVLKKRLIKQVAQTLKHELRHSHFARRSDLIFRSLTERRVKEEIANSLLDYLDNRNKSTLSNELSFYQTHFNVPEKTFNKWLLEVSSTLDKWNR